MSILASNLDQVFGTVTPPPELNNLVGNGKTGAEGINIFLATAIQLIYLLAAIFFIFMILMGAFQWITSGGEKENVAKARGRITHAIIGITLLALSFLMIAVIGQILGFNHLFYLQGLFSVPNSFPQ